MKFKSRLFNHLLPAGDVTAYRNYNMAKANIRQACISMREDILRIVRLSGEQVFK